MIELITQKEIVRSIKFDRNGDNIFKCFGIDGALGDQLMNIINEYCDQGKTWLDIIEHVRDNMDLNISQFSAFMFAIGNYNGRLMSDDDTHTKEMLQIVGTTLKKYVQSFPPKLHRYLELSKEDFKAIEFINNPEA